MIQHFAHILKPSFRSLLFLLAAGMFLFSCKEDDDEMKRSSEATMTTLTLTLEDTDYEITFKDRQDTITVPYNTKLPGEAKVKAVELSAKATGVTVGETLTIPASEPLTITITAEDETTTQEYTVAVKKKLAPISISATEVAKVATTDVRDSYGIFNLKTNKEEVKDYYIAVKEASATAPNKAEMENLALKRNVNTDGINVLIAQRLNAPIVAFANTYFADNTKKTVPAGMIFSAVANATGLVVDNTATGADALVSESVLKPSTSYNLYGMDGEGAVEKLLTFSTDASIVYGSKATTNEPVLLDQTMKNGHIILSIRADEIYILPIQVDSKATSTDQVRIQGSHQVDITMPLDLGIAANICFGGADVTFTDFLTLVTSPTTDGYKNYLNSSYILTNPKKAQDISSQDSWNYSIAYSRNSVFSSFSEFPTLSIQ